MMIRNVVAGIVLVAGLLTSSVVAVAARAAGVTQAATQVTAADAAPFLGDWSLALDGPNGAQSLDLSISVDKDAVGGSITGLGMGTQSITDVTKADKSLVLRYSFDYQGNPIPAMVTLTPAAEGRTNAQIDFAGGAYVMSGTATRNDKK